MRSLFFTVVAYLTCVGPAIYASPIADVICAPTDRMEQKLRVQFGNTPMAMGVRSPTEIMEIWTGDAGDWTLVITYSSGRSCIVAMGQDWVSLREKEPA